MQTGGKIGGDVPSTLRRWGSQASLFGWVFCSVQVRFSRESCARSYHCWFPTCFFLLLVVLLGKFDRILTTAPNFAERIPFTSVAKLPNGWILTLKKTIFVSLLQQTIWTIPKGRILVLATSGQPTRLALELENQLQSVERSLAPLLPQIRTSHICIKVQSFVSPREYLRARRQAFWSLTNFADPEALRLTFSQSNRFAEVSESESYVSFTTLLLPELWQHIITFLPIKTVGLCVSFTSFASSPISLFWAS